MNKPIATLRKGATLFDVLDEIEAAVVHHMAERRGLTEQAFRNLLGKDKEVAGSYCRKISRSLRATGLNHAKLVGR